MAKTSNISARVYNSIDQTIPDASYTALTFDSERFDNGDLHSTTTNTSRLTAPANGVYLISAHLEFDGWGYNRQIRLTQNGTTIIGFKNGFANIEAVLNISTSAFLLAGDYVEVIVWQGTGEDRLVTSSSSMYGDDYQWSPEFSMVRIASD